MPAPQPAISKADNDYRDRYEQLTGSSLSKCPVCHQGPFNGILQNESDQQGLMRLLVVDEI
jgi:hypothetical protein